MSGSPIIDANGAAIGVVSVNISSPVIVDSLSAQLVRAILAAKDGVEAKT
jgi:sensor histidine kinase regulating citrate/malate metabolism